MAEQRVTEITFLATVVNVDADCRVSSEAFLSADENENADCRVTEIVWVNICRRRSGGIFREMITPMTSHEE
jgi:hypothetical protein